MIYTMARYVVVRSFVQKDAHKMQIDGKPLCIKSWSCIESNATVPIGLVVCVFASTSWNSNRKAFTAVSVRSMCVYNLYKNKKKKIHIPCTLQLNYTQNRKRNFLFFLLASKQKIVLVGYCARRRLHFTFKMHCCQQNPIFTKFSSWQSSEISNESINRRLFTESGMHNFTVKKKSCPFAPDACPKQISNGKFNFG